MFEPSDLPRIARAFFHAKCTRPVPGETRLKNGVLSLQVESAEDCARKAIEVLRKYGAGLADDVTITDLGDGITEARVALITDALWVSDEPKRSN